MENSKKQIVQYTENSNKQIASVMEEIRKISMIRETHSVITVDSDSTLNVLKKRKISERECIRINSPTPQESISNGSKSYASAATAAPSGRGISRLDLSPDLKEIFSNMLKPKRPPRAPLLHGSSDHGSLVLSADVDLVAFRVSRDADL